jgi:tRNA modification GTPase
VASEVDSVQRGCSALCASFRGGQAARLGITAALVGPVNVGKSSLLNALVGVERALVAPQPGTTRDWLEVTTTWSGIAVTLVDTAGDRATESPIEQRGIELGRERASLADVVILVNDGEAPWDSGARFGARLIVVRSKADREGRTEPGALATSATTGHGLEALRQRILEVAGAADREGSEHAVVTTARQAALAEAARAHSAATLERLRAGAPLELVAAELREVARSLAQLRGVEVGDRVLDEVFSRFCIGK